jgi:hypothetical protein
MMVADGSAEFNSDKRDRMTAGSITIPESCTDRYEALLRATHAIGSCGDCDRAGDMLLNALLEVVPFDYLQLVAFEPESNIVEWHLFEWKKAEFTSGRGCGGKHSSRVGA